MLLQPDTRFKMPAGESTNTSHFDKLDTIAARTHALLVEIVKHDELQWRIYDFFRHHDPDQWRVCDYFWGKAPDMNLKEYHALHKTLRAAIYNSDKIVAGIILKSNVLNDVATQIFQATKELLDFLLLNQEQQLVLYSTHLTDISKHVSFFQASLKMNITITNKMIIDLRTKVCYYIEN